MLRYLNWNHKLRKILHTVVLLAQGKVTFFQMSFHSDTIHLSIAVHRFHGPDLASSHKCTQAEYLRVAKSCVNVTTYHTVFLSQMAPYSTICPICRETCWYQHSTFYLWSTTFYSFETLKFHWHLVKETRSKLFSSCLK